MEFFRKFMPIDKGKRVVVVPRSIDRIDEIESLVKYGKIGKD